MSIWFKTTDKTPRTPIRPTAPPASQVNLVDPTIINRDPAIVISSSSERAHSETENSVETESNENNTPNRSGDRTPEINDSEEEHDPIKIPINYNISVKDVLELVQKFDGNNLSTFFSQIEDAKSMVGSDGEATLVLWLKIKLPTEARKAIGGKEYKKVSEFKKALETYYCLSRSIPQLQGELGNIYQKQDESVLSYANRIREIERQILEVKRGGSDQESDATFKGELSAMVIESFKRGINRDLYPVIRGETDATTIVEKAIREEKEFHCRKGLQPTEITKKKIMSVEAPSTSTTEICQLCKKANHTAKNCPNLPKCQLCQRVGHTARDCKRE
uniref:CCHC-type domain-containing protein n=1 Tax=Trichogramma kaykai TaxID=54128 RepID=A0ABD2WAR0_9HYME